LPENIGDRIRNDQTGSAATPGHLIRSMLAFLAAYAGVGPLLPGSLAALVLAVLLALADSLVFIAVSRRLDQQRRADECPHGPSARTRARAVEPHPSAS
jgi:hypothetical protein